MTSAVGSGRSRADGAERLVLAWTRRYTAGVREEVAAARVAELRSDLWEQKADARWHHRRDLAIALDLLSRALRGIPADLTWRRAELRRLPHPPTPRFALVWNTRVGVFAAGAIGTAAVALAVLAAARLVMVPEYSASVTSTAKASLVVGIVAAVCGLSLLRRPATRALAALWTGFGTIVAFRSAADTLLSLSTTARQYATPAALPLAWVTLGALGVFFVVLALSWALEPRGRE